MRLLIVISFLIILGGCTVNNVEFESKYTRSTYFENYCNEVENQDYEWCFQNQRDLCEATGGKVDIRCDTNDFNLTSDEVANDPSKTCYNRKTFCGCGGSEDIIKRWNPETGCKEIDINKRII